MKKQEVDCLIIGAGPVGLTLACQLRQYGVSCRVLDKVESPVIRTKAAGIWSRTVEFLDQMGLAEKFLDEGLRCYGASIFADGKRIAHLHLEGIDSFYNFILLIPQHETERILREHLQQLGADVEYGQALSSLRQDSDKVVAVLESGEEIEAQWLVGCDGAHSRVRHSLGLEFVGQKLDTQWIVSDLKVRGLPLGEEVQVYLHEEGPTAFFPLGNYFYRLVAETEPLMDASNEGRARFEVERLINHPVHIEDSLASPSAFIPFCSLGGDLAILGRKSPSFSVPVCAAFREKIVGGQLCYETHLSAYAGMNSWKVAS